ncbi:MAG: S-adenosylmethionine:tRNA ribosyltransferase-isomerase [Phycisphaerales bacterium]
MLPTRSLEYDLPEDLVATRPARPRDSARMMVLRRSEPGRVEHRKVRDLAGYLSSRDLVVVNQTRVLSARFRCVRADTGGLGEGLFLSEVQDNSETASAGCRWRVLLKLRRAKAGCLVNLLTPSGSQSGVRLRLVGRASPEDTSPASGDGWCAEVECDPAVWLDATTASILECVGLPPIPPYILASRRKHGEPEEQPDDAVSYQTVFAGQPTNNAEPQGSIAAPTAGLHLTPSLLRALEVRGVERREVVLSVGMGTFRPVETDYVEQHPMHSEWCMVPGATAEAIRARTAPSGSLVLAVGTTTARTLESYRSTEEMLECPTRKTAILITPGHRFVHFSALLTNFHLPRSTLMAMVAAFLDDDDRVRGRGLERLLAAYALAVQERYRFYSFGDAMLILP